MSIAARQVPAIAPGTVVPARQELSHLLVTLLAKVDTSSDGQLGRISQQDRCEIAADRGQRSLWVRQVLRAEQDGPDRWILVFDSETPGCVPELGGLRNCHPGRTTVDDE